MHRDLLKCKKGDKKSKNRSKSDPTFSIINTF